MAGQAARLMCFFILTSSILNQNLTHSRNSVSPSKGFYPTIVGILVAVLMENKDAPATTPAPSTKPAPPPNDPPTPWQRALARREVRSAGDFGSRSGIQNHPNKVASLSR
jgi:hypothetical protein